MEKIPDYGDLMTLDEFWDCIRSGMITDDDGSGYWATDTEYDYGKPVAPGQNFLVGKPEWATHVMWFNK